MKSCDECDKPLVLRQKRFCSTICLGLFYGKKNKGKSYNRHLKNYHGNQTTFKKGISISPKTQFKKGERVSKSTEFKKGNNSWNSGKHWDEKTKEKMRLKKLGVYVGEKNPNWRGGTTPILMRLRRISQYLIWRKQVFERDDYTCQICGVRGSIIHADHVKPFATYPDSRFDLNNGRTLCVPCHRATPTYGCKTKI